MERGDRRFWFRIALALGKSVKQCQREIDSAEFSEWQAYYQVEPFGQERDNMHAALVACTVANCHGARSSLKDFMLEFGRKVKKQTIKQMMAILESFTNWFNGKQKHEDDDQRR